MKRGAVYNEIDPFCVEWLRRLILADLIAPGDVDDRSILDVSPDDWRDYAQVHAFAGIGVWSHSLRRSGWPDDRPVWTGSCPCQPFSQAGKGEGFADERHLWPAWHWLIDQSKPDYVLGEQVASKDGLAWFDLVSSDLEGSGYAVGATDQCVAGFGGPHIRQRLWFVGLQQSASNGREQRRPESERRGVERRCGLSGLSDSQGDGRSGRTHDSDEGRRQRASGPDSPSSGLRHAPGERRGEERAARGGREKRSSDAGAVGDAGGSPLSGLHGRAGRQQPSTDDERRLGARIIEGSGAEPFGDIGGPLYADVKREHPAGDEKRFGDTCGPSSFVRPPDNNNTGLALGSFDDDGRRTLRFEGSAFGADEPVRGFWSGADWLWYRDGKYRPVEAGTFPLAPSSPGRVGRLRAYGNAVNAEVCAGFVEAVMSLCP